MDFTLVPSLEHIALVTVATSMWNKLDIKDLVEQNDIPPLSNQLDKTIAKVKERLNKIPLPKPLKKELSRFIRPIGHEIWTWLHCEHGYSSFDMRNTDHFYWTNQGTIDTKKTAQKLVQDEKMDLDTCYKIAAIHCLEDDFYSLRKKYENINKVCDVSFTLLVESCLQNKFVKQNYLITELYHLRRSNSRNVYMFCCAAFGGNEAATRYFLRKLTSKEREMNLVWMIHCLGVERTFHHPQKCLLSYKNHYANNVLCLLLSIMSKEQRAMAFQKTSFTILRGLLNYPWQYLFLEIVEHAMTFFDDFDFFYLMTLIFAKIAQPYKDFDYESLLSVVWQKCPTAIKKSWLVSGVPFKKMLLSCGTENSVLYLNDILVLEGKEIIFKSKGKEICKCLIEKKLWDLFKFFIEKCISSGDSMAKFKEEFSDFIKISCSSWTKDMREMALDIINDCC